MRALNSCRSFSCCVGLFFVVAVGSAQDAEAALDRAASVAQEERLSAWPKLLDKERTLKDIERLRRATTAEMGIQAQAALIADGAGTVPLLLPILEKEKDEAVLARLHKVLATVTSPTHSRLLAREFEHRAASVRIWALKQAAKAGDKELALAAEKALALARGRAAKLDQEECYAAALCALSAGSLLGLDEVRGKARSSWKQAAAEIREAAVGAKGAPGSQALCALLAGADREDTVVLLRLLAVMGESSATGAIRPFLDNNDNSLRIAAINALRGIVDAEAPLDELPVFEAIEHAKRWKARLGTGP